MSQLPTEYDLTVLIDQLDFALLVPRPLFVLLAAAVCELKLSHAASSCWPYASAGILTQAGVINESQTKASIQGAVKNRMGYCNPRGQPKQSSIRPRSDTSP
jgi:hypothetical protein